MTETPQTPVPKGIPPGYRQTKLIDPFEIYVGPVYETGEGSGLRFALLVDERHVNMRGIIHGGMLMTYADCTLGWAVWGATDFAPSVTMNMQTQFLKPARQGDVIEVQPQITRKTQSLIFARGDFTIKGEVIFSAQSIWKLLGKN